MDIVVQGKACKCYKPDEVTIKLEFYTNEKTYEDALKKGTAEVKLFINEVLEKMSFDKEDLKTTSLKIYEEKKFDYNKQEEIKLGFSYKQNAILKFDYDIEKISDFIERMSKLENNPNYTFEFNLKNEDECKAEVMKLAYLNAKLKAENIALATEKNIKECLKIDYKPFAENVIAGSRLEENNLVYKSMKINENSVQDTIKNIFTPEDICVTEEIYCLWLAE